jgi:imidazolonepropionase-like amidohydrolase
MKKLTLALLVTLAAAVAFAQTPSKPIALKAAHIFDATSDNMLSNGVVIVDGNHIVAAGSGIAIPANAQVIDLGDATLLPGFIDAHVHMTEESGDNWYKDHFDSEMRFPAEQSFYAASYALKTLNAGFTTVRNVGAQDYVDVGLRNAINNGIVPGPRMLVAVHAIGATGGHGDGDPMPPERTHQLGPIDGVCNGAAECRAAVRYQIKYGADVIKFMPSGGVLSLSDPVDAPELSQEEMNAIVEEAHNWGRKVAAHCHGDAAAKMAIIAGTDSIEHGSFMKPDTLAMMREKGTYLVPTRMAVYWTGSPDKVGRFPPVIQAKAKAAYAAHEQRAQGRREDRVRHRLRRLAARPQRARVLPHDRPRHVPRRRPPLRNIDECGSSRPRRSHRHARSRQAGGRRRGARQRADRHQSDRARDLRHEGREGREGSGGEVNV